AVSKLLRVAIEGSSQMARSGVVAAGFGPWVVLLRGHSEGNTLLHSRHVGEVFPSRSRVLAARADTRSVRVNQVSCWRAPLVSLAVIREYCCVTQSMGLDNDDQ